MIFNIIKYAAQKPQMKKYITSKIINVWGFIKKLPNGFDTIMGKMELNYLVEKQRLSIARAFLKNSRYFTRRGNILTRFRNWATNSGSTIKIALNKTTIVIALRLSAILQSHKIFVFDKGEVISQGNHNELIKNSDAYRNFYDRQIKQN